MRIIQGFNHYCISMSGDVINNKTGKLLKHMIVRKGYHLVALYKDGKRFYKSVSRLVAEAFIDNPENKPEVNHKDGDKDNNNDWNLEWVTTKENIHHAMKNNLRVRSENCGKKRIPIQVIDYKSGLLLSEQPSISEAARVYNLSQGNIGEIIKGNRKQTNGVTFKIVN